MQRVGPSGGSHPGQLPSEPPYVRAVLGSLDWSVDGETIDRARILRGWTRRDLARTARIDEGTLSDLLASRRRPTLATLRAICEATGLTIEDVVAFCK